MSAYDAFPTFEAFAYTLLVACWGAAVKFGTLILAFTLIWSAAFAQTVTVTGGKIHGAMLEKGGAVFRGIPFAAPPVGDLRWREPMPVKPWSGVREAALFGPACTQKPGGGVPREQATETSSEDCLYLNVWTPEWPARTKMPVMVWIHGGANAAGTASQKIYDTDTLARRGVVVVTLNYRLGAFGFFSHPALTRESPHHASGNQGILDQIAALRWVRDNIASFGGDPNNVTIFGESAGSVAGSVLATSPLSRGLFHRVIGESGAAVLAGDPSILSEAEKRGQALAQRWKLTSGASATELRAVSAADILNAEPNLFEDNPPHIPSTLLAEFPNLGIVVDGYVFPKKPAEIFAAGEEHRVAFLFGSNARERIPGTAAPAELAPALDQFFGPLSQRAREVYVGAPDALYGTTAEQWSTDTSFRCATVAQLIWHSAAGNPAYQYEFARVPPGREAVGATHASDLYYVFGSLNRIGGVGAPPVPGNAIDAQVSDAMQRYWTNFAKTGDPNGPGLPEWPKFDPAKRAYIQFTDAGPLAKEGLRRPYCDLFIENLQRRS